MLTNASIERQVTPFPVPLTLNDTFVEVQAVPGSPKSSVWPTSIPRYSDLQLPFELQSQYHASLTQFASHSWSGRSMPWYQTLADLEVFGNLYPRLKC